MNIELKESALIENLLLVEYEASRTTSVVLHQKLILEAKLVQKMPHLGRFAIQ